LGSLSVATSCDDEKVVTYLCSGLTGSGLSASIRRVQSGQDVRECFWMHLRLWFALGLASAAVLVTAGCSRSWQDRGPEPRISTAVATMAAAPASAVRLPPPAETEAPALAARVNGQPILLVDFERRLAELWPEVPGQGVITATVDEKAFRATAEQQVLDDMIDTLLVQQAAAELGLVPSDAEIAAQVQADIAAGGGSLAFSEWLAATGQTTEEYSTDVRSFLILQRVVVAVTADAVAGLQEDDVELRARVFREWLVERRKEASVERWIGR